MMLVLLCAVTIAAAPVANEKAKLAVMFLTSQGVEQSTVDIIDELVLDAVHRVGKYDVTGAADVKAMLEVSLDRLRLGCDEASCMSEIAGALGVSLVITGSVARLGDQIIISLKLLNVEAGQALERSQVTIDDDENLFAKAAERAVDELLDAENLRARLAAQKVEERTFKRTIGWVSAGGAVALVGGAATLWLIRPDVSVSYDAYKAAQEPNDVAARYRTVENDVSSHNTMTYLGWAFLAAGVGAAAFSAFEFWTAPEPETSVEIGGAPTEGGAALFVGGKF